MVSDGVTWVVVRVGEGMDFSLILIGRSHALERGGAVEGPLICRLVIGVAVVGATVTMASLHIREIIIVMLHHRAPVLVPTTGGFQFG